MQSVCHCSSVPFFQPQSPGSSCHTRCEPVSYGPGFHSPPKRLVAWWLVTAGETSDSIHLDLFVAVIHIQNVVFLSEETMKKDRHFHVTLVVRSSVRRKNTMAPIDINHHES